MSDQCTKQDFLEVVADHSIDIIKDDGVHRHISFSNKGSFNGKFDLITWPGSLCICGDYGTYVYSRTNDMFGFFRRNDLSINPGYWGQKLQAIDPNCGYREFCEASFRERVKDHFDAHWDGVDDEFDEDKSECWNEIEEFVLSCAADKAEAYSIAVCFEHKHRNGTFTFQDFFDGGATERYTFNYLWNLYAIVWGIQKYDAACNVL